MEEQTARREGAFGAQIPHYALRAPYRCSSARVTRVRPPYRCISASVGAMSEPQWKLRCATLRAGTRSPVVGVGETALDGLMPINSSRVAVTSEAKACLPRLRRVSCMVITPHVQTHRVIRQSVFYQLVFECQLLGCRVCGKVYKNKTFQPK